MVWNAGLEQGYIGENKHIPGDIDSKILTIGCTEECVLLCRSDPNCKRTIATPSLVMATHSTEAGTDNCWLVYTEY